MTETAVTYCRLCQACCGLVVEIDDGRVVAARGDGDNPASRGFTCPKGRNIGEYHHHPDRVLGSRRRDASGGWSPIATDLAIEEVGRRLQEIREAHGPDAIATFWGTQANLVTPTRPVALKWWKALGSHKAFTTATIDQSAKVVMWARMGQYLGGAQPFSTSDVFLLAGGNPVVSMFALPPWGLDVPANDPVTRFREAKDRGLKLIVVDPRRTETTRFADLHLQPRPGTDAALFAAILHVIFRDGLDDPGFWRRYANGADALRAAVADATPEAAGRFCGLDPGMIVEAAHLFGEAGRGMAGGATGTDMAPRANLTEHLIACLNVVCGRYLREGEPVPAEGLLRPAPPRRAQVTPPNRTWETGWQSRLGFGLLPSPHGGELPATILPEEILSPGEDQVRALVVIAGNPVAAIPDQDRVIEALEAVELLVVIDPWMSETARLAHYVIAPTLPLERADHTGWIEAAQSVPLAQYTAAVLPRPGDVIDDWELFWGIAEQMDIDLDLGVGDGTKPTTDELLTHLARRGTVPLDTVKANPHGLVVDAPEGARVLPPEPGAEHHRLELLPDDVADELAAMVAEDLAPGSGSEDGFHLVVRRAKESFNSSGRQIERLHRAGGTNPLFVHPDDLARIGAEAGSRVRIRSVHGEIQARVAADATLRAGVVAMTHSWGGLPGDDHEEPGIGSNTGRLVSRSAPVETISHMPRLTAIPVELTPVDGDPTS